MSKLKKQTVDYDIKKVKFTDGGLELSFRKTVTEDSTTNVIDFDNVRSTYDTHQDLKDLVEGLKHPILQTCNMHLGIELFFQEGLMIDKNIKPKVKEEMKSKIHTALLDNIRIYGIGFKGEGDARSVIITGGIENANGVSTINTSNIFLGQTKLGYEEELDNTVTMLKDEVIKYINGKNGALELFEPQKVSEIEEAN